MQGLNSVIKYHMAEKGTPALKLPPMYKSTKTKAKANESLQKDPSKKNTPQKNPPQQNLHWS